MRDYIAQSSSNARQNRKEYLLFNRITVQVTDPLPQNINLKNILNQIETKVPKRLLEDIETIYIGNYKPLQDRQIDSMYVDGSIMVTNNQPSDKEMFGTFIHEFAHAIEEKYKSIIYSDGALAREFLAKRNTLFNLLKDDFEIDKRSFLDINFNQSFDDFVYKTVGYENLGVITGGLFISPYACTSLREYFANGFEHYFLNDHSEIKEKSPALLKKVREVLKTR